ncbi:hypothetical protein A2715_03655 [Candidatus Woesebacteria bacterium RIFCSPHIGHO2_01_FULL_39_32]|uniref:Bacteriocin-protection protein, YdeI/OmpD-associated family n=1 Tax=Candidatus Woesebacteria bacterium RIFCSPLOWO2_01_FULL_39_25 TaxID=1802521 RepID=A0A1F8BKW7_9BACT|nr:MAG: hypothetical protein A2715_03655 [Candidatus Woesebacteria bacterium RIFCSPHIGHO2_01_FULL_39_32]OGM37157.1 MAG: hypothetical protein A3F01_05595 [Candidatus Woesebacteria bacterium RIFCSPHIGHO2_12_FULL_38_11]OGM64662.1 MAG: hypothetical protein A2893_06570 [Candidatus Woesebacteria bacterium RIFCSPLOWO2_01_FULL_39_25]
MEITETLFVENRNKWRKWLKNYHDKEKEVWLIYFKKHTGKFSIAYNDAVEEAICFGWIDGKVRSIDAEKYMQRFSPRNPDSVWSLLNKKRALKMIKEGKMTGAGLKTIKYAKKTGKWQAAYSSKTKPGLPPDLKRALKENVSAYKNFDNFSNSQQLAYIFWILSAKRDETRKGRVKIVVERSSKNLKPQWL